MREIEWAKLNGLIKIVQNGSKIMKNDPERVSMPRRVSMPQRECPCPGERCVILRDEERVITRAPDLRLT